VPSTAADVRPTAELNYGLTANAALQSSVVDPSRAAPLGWRRERELVRRRAPRSTAPTNGVPSTVADVPQ
jgi:hypothetical protein